MQDVRDLVRDIHPATEVVAAPFDDLALDLSALDELLSHSPPRSWQELRQLEDAASRQKATAPLITDESVDIVVAASALRLVRPSRRRNVVEEIFRVLRRGGVALITEVVSDEPLPERLLNEAENPAAFQELELLELLEAVGFYGMRITHWDEEPCCRLEGIEMRTISVEARKGKQGPCVERYQGVIYKGPWKVVEDDDGHVIKRGQRFAVCDKTFNIYKQEPYAGQFIYLEPAVEIPREQAQPWDPRHPAERLPAETKGERRVATSALPSSGGAGYIVRVEWRRRDGVLERRAKVADRYRGAFETAEAALSTARKAFPDASRFWPEPVTADEVLRQLAKRGKTLACPLPEKKGEA